MSVSVKEAVNHLSEKYCGIHLFDENGNVDKKTVLKTVSNKAIKQIKDSDGVSQLKKEDGELDISKIIVRVMDNEDLGLAIGEDGNLVISTSMEDLTLFAVKIHFGTIETIRRDIDDIAIGQHNDRKGKIEGILSVIRETRAGQKMNPKLESLSDELRKEMGKLELELQHNVEYVQKPFTNKVQMFIPGTADKIARKEKEAEDSIQVYMNALIARIEIMIDFDAKLELKQFIEDVEQFMSIFTKEAIESLQAWDADAKKRADPEFWSKIVGNLKGFVSDVSKSITEKCVKIEV